MILASFLLAFCIAVPGKSSAAESLTFKDVDGTFWAKDAIDGLVQAGIVRGYTDGTFKPNDPVSREEFASLITQTFYLDLTWDSRRKKAMKFLSILRRLCLR